MSQLTFAEAEYQGKKRKTRREKFLERMDGLIPWKKLEQQLAKKYSNGKVGRKPYPLSVMLRVHVMQLLYNLSDPAMEDALYEIESMRRFAGLSLYMFNTETGQFVTAKSSPKPHEQQSFITDSLQAVYLGSVLNRLI